MQNMGLAVGHRGQAHVKKNETHIYIFRSAPEFRALRGIGVRKGRLNGKMGLSDGRYYMNRRVSFGG